MTTRGYKIRAWQLADDLTVAVSRRLGYLAQEEQGSLSVLAEEVSRTLTGLIRAVEKEAGLISRSVAKLTSLLVLAVPGSAVCGV